MQVTDANIQQLLGGPKQFRVPLFQRTHTWKERDHAQLWRDILGQYELARTSGASASGQDGHFIGSFVLAPTPAPATLPAYLVVDGQQRLTTLTVALCALRDAAAPSDASAFERITNQYLVNPYAHEERDRWKFVPTQPWDRGTDRAERRAALRDARTGTLAWPGRLTTGCGHRSSSSPPSTPSRARG